MSEITSGLSLFDYNKENSSASGSDEQKFVFTVSSLTRQIKDALKQKAFIHIWVGGEISNVSYAKSGHVYFDIKDEYALLKCAMFKRFASGLKFKLEPGQKVEVFGSVSVYEKRGYYQIIAEKVTAEGIGDLQLAYEQLKKKLKQEGLFERRYKKSIPLYPERVALITSSTGAAVRDIIQTTNIHFPGVHLIIMPTVVQGDKAAAGIARMIRLANEKNIADVLIIGRGGGSLEDLWAFNEEEVARAVYASRIPVISAVGHEVDFFISDFVADYRAATPTAAAEYISQNKKELAAGISFYDKRIINAVNSRIAGIRYRLEACRGAKVARILQNMHDKLVQELDDLKVRAVKGLQDNYKEKQNFFLQINGKLTALSPYNIMQRGYAVVMKNNKAVKQSSQLAKGD
ncbi:MAG TPA: exodeoxyribonuclease VII large subunit, partial [Spirochaetota bacterium]|nr:exodeoxyribonuclease VII large subunit [Spirochaetota bacterium]